MNEEQLRRHLLMTTRAMQRQGINTGTAGNVSVRCNTGFLITPSGRAYEHSTPSEMVKMQLDGRWEGTLQPSSEWRFHRDIYRHRPEVQAVVHAHPTYCTSLACMRQGIPAFHYMVAIAGGEDIRCADYATFGTQQLSDQALLALEGRNACLLANHGLLCLASSLNRALTLAVEVEQLAKSYCQILQMGNPVLLDREEMQRVLEKFREYDSHRER